MRTILIPTDFSKCALNAANYAIELAKITNSKLVLYHSYFYSTPLGRPEAFFDANQLEDVKINAFKMLEELANDQLKLPTMDIEYVLDHSMSIGNLASEVNEMCSKHQVDLIVMGTHGATGMIQKVLIGSNAASMIASAHHPVMIIPEKWKFSKLYKIVFATSLDEIKDEKLLEPLTELSWLIAPEIKFLVVVKSDDDLPSDEQMEQYLKLHAYFNHATHRLHTIVDHDTLRGINNYILEDTPDLVVTIPRKQSFFQQLFGESISKELAYESLVPILCLK
ncbi:MAG TPA: universal stress protein [Saprospiraceae bacterium]|nr:universal stress protein [Saprospiraceae bacterium]